MSGPQKELLLAVTFTVRQLVSEPARRFTSGPVCIGPKRETSCIFRRTGCDM